LNINLHDSSALISVIKDDEVVIPIDDIIEE
jgi:hypothetical protein